MLNPVLLHDWASDVNSDGIEGIIRDFDINKESLSGVELLLASYTYQCYEGEAFVLFKKDGKLFEVNGNHCSCHGLENQWIPEETSREELIHRINNGNLGRGYSNNVFATQLLEVLGGDDK